MKRNTLVKIVVAYLAVLLVGTALAAYWIYSNTVTVTVSEYTLTLTAPSEVIKYQNVTLTAHLTKDGSAVSGATVYFYNVTGGTKTQLGTGLTNSTGYATYTFNATQTGTFTFQAGYQVP